MTMLGYARVSTGHQTDDQQHDGLIAAGVPADRIYSDTMTGTSTRDQRPGLSALLDYAREGDTIVVIGVDRLGRSVDEVMATVADLLKREIIIKALREGVDSSTPTGRAVMGIMASLAELELELGKERRAAAKAARKARDLPIGRPAALTSAQVAQARRLHSGGEPVPEIARLMGVSRATMYRALQDA